MTSVKKLRTWQRCCVLWIFLHQWTNITTTRRNTSILLCQGFSLGCCFCVATDGDIQGENIEGQQSDLLKFSSWTFWPLYIVSTAIVVTPPCTEGKHDWILNRWINLCQTEVALALARCGNGPMEMPCMPAWWWEIPWFCPSYSDCTGAATSSCRQLCMMQTLRFVDVAGGGVPLIPHELSSCLSLVSDFSASKWKGGRRLPVIKSR